jgi:Zn-dependent protease with chaperone function
MDFFDQEAHARKQTRRLIWLFGLAVLAVVTLTYLVLALIILFFLKPVWQNSVSLWQNSVFDYFDNFPVPPAHDGLIHPLRVLEKLWNPHLFCWTAISTLILIATGCLYKIRLLSDGGPAVAELLGGRRLESSPSNLDEQRLRDVVEEMAVASEMAVPEIYVLDRERGINSFAAGHTREDVAIGVTFGCLKLLTRDELQGVVAHEFSHVLNGDTRFNMKLMGLAHGLFWPTIVGRILVRGSTRAPEIGDSIFDADEGVHFLPTAPVGFLFLMVGGISAPFVRWLKSVICREREWLADAAAVQFTRNPAGIAGALKKIGGLYKAGRLDTPYAETASHLYFSSSDYDPWFNFLATHPPLAKRILAIDPTFDGQFPHINSLPRQTDETSQEKQYDRLYEENVRRARKEAKAHRELQ